MTIQTEERTTRAYRLLLRAGIRVLPVPVEALARHAAPGVLLASYAEYERRTGLARTALAESGMADGLTFLSPRGARVILYNEAKSEARRRFTICHEIGHIVCGHTRHGHAEEAEANDFAARLLMPDALLRFARDRRQAVTAEFLSVCFGVSRAAARRKLAALSAFGFGEAHTLDNAVRLLFQDALYAFAPAMSLHDRPGDLFGSEENRSALVSIENALLEP